MVFVVDTVPSAGMSGDAVVIGVAALFAHVVILAVVTCEASNPKSPGVADAVDFQSLYFDVKSVAVESAGL
jgi:hypothetical protein